MRKALANECGVRRSVAKGLALRAPDSSAPGAPGLTTCARTGGKPVVRWCSGGSCDERGGTHRGDGKLPQRRTSCAMSCESWHAGQELTKGRAFFEAWSARQEPTKVRVSECAVEERRDGALRAVGHAGGDVALFLGLCDPLDKRL